MTHDGETWGIMITRRRTPLRGDDPDLCRVEETSALHERLRDLYDERNFFE
jgi:hypothetical protein